MNQDTMTSGVEHTIGIVVPVYRGEHVLPELLNELDRYTMSRVSAGGANFRISEVILVHDSGPDHSDTTIRGLAERYEYVRPVWLSRNFGQHAATLAGMSSTSADWIVTMDEDGQHDPEAIGSMLDTALATGSQVVYAEPTNTPPHSFFRNFTSATAHWAARLMGGGPHHRFHSFRLVLGEIGRGLAAYCGESVYLDVALTWVVDRTTTCPVAMREERGGRSGYSTRRLASHFWRMVLTSGTRPLRLVALFGILLALGALVLMGWVFWARLNNEVPVQGWTSVMVILLVTSGGVLFSLGILAEYLAIASKSAMGKPLYLVVSDPAEGPLGRASEHTADMRPVGSETPPRAEPAMPSKG
jgi:glycosyltransferase involved in cell wall biosynthesis